MEYRSRRVPYRTEAKIDCIPSRRRKTPQLMKKKKKRMKKREEEEKGLH